VWNVVVQEEDGKDDLPKGGVTVTFKGDQAVYKAANETAPSVATFKVDATKKPKHLDLVLPPDPKEKDDKGLTIQAIYQLDGDNLEVCYLLPGPKDKNVSVTVRPATITSKDGHKMLKLKRAPK
jgi:uncharacterized protein (TIGR03067 family)